MASKISFLVYSLLSPITIKDNLSNALSSLFVISSWMISYSWVYSAVTMFSST